MKYFFLVSLMVSIYMSMMGNIIACPSYYFRSDSTGSVGVFAGRNISEGDILDRTLGFSVGVFSSQKTALNHYVFNNSLSETETVLYLGLPMMFNHNATANIVMNRYESLGSFNVEVKAKRNITIGEELLSFYGTSWFESRQTVTQKRPGQYEFTTPLPGCPYTYTKVTAKGLQAVQNIKKGTVIEVSRGIIVPGVRTIATSVEPLMWYSERSNIGCMLLLGHGAYYSPARDSARANVYYKWYQHADSQENVTCHEYMLMAFVAARNIIAGELLTIPLFEDDLIGHVGEKPVRRKRVINSLLQKQCF
jgi:hypothetical protein